MRFPRWTWMSLLVISWLAGCSSTAKRETWEARLRDREDELYSLQEELSTLKKELALRERESDDLRLRFASNKQPTVLAEQSAAYYQVSGIKINSLLTGGLNRDGQEGDDLFSVLIAPHDEDGSLLKLTGRLQFELHDFSLPTSEQVIGRWEFTSAEMKEHWHSGFVGSGYLFDLNWQTIPQHNELTLHARLTTGDQRQFDTSQLVSIQIPSSEGNRRAVPNVVYGPEIKHENGPVELESATLVDPPSQPNRSGSVLPWGDSLREEADILVPNPQDLEQYQPTEEGQLQSPDLETTEGEKGWAPPEQLDLPTFNSDRWTKFNKPERR